MSAGIDVVYCTNFWASRPWEGSIIECPAGKSTRETAGNSAFASVWDLL